MDISGIGFDPASPEATPRQVGFDPASPEATPRQVGFVLGLFSHICKVACFHNPLLKQNLRSFEEPANWVYLHKTTRMVEIRNPNIEILNKSEILISKSPG